MTNSINVGWTQLGILGARICIICINDSARVSNLVVVNDTLAVNDIRVVNDILLVLVGNDTLLSFTGTAAILPVLAGAYLVLTVRPTKKPTKMAKWNI
jgi:hypothetical protein